MPSSELTINPYQIIFLLHTQRAVSVCATRLVFLDQHRPHHPISMSFFHFFPYRFVLFAHDIKSSDIFTEFFSIFFFCFVFRFRKIADANRTQTSTLILVHVFEILSSECVIAIWRNNQKNKEIHDAEVISWVFPDSDCLPLYFTTIEYSLHSFLYDFFYIYWRFVWAHLCVCVCVCEFHKVYVHTPSMHVNRE